MFPPKGIVAWLPLANWLLKFHEKLSKSPRAVMVVSAPAQIAIFPSTVSSGKETSKTSITIVTSVADAGLPSSVAIISMVLIPGTLPTNSPAILAVTPSITVNPSMVFPTVRFCTTSRVTDCPGSGPRKLIPMSRVWPKHIVRVSHPTFSVGTGGKLVLETAVFKSKNLKSNQLIPSTSSSSIP